MFKLKNTLARDIAANPKDVVNVKNGLNRLGFFPAPSYGFTEYPDERMFAAIEALQSATGLKRDGLMRVEYQCRRLPSAVHSLPICR